MPRETRGKVGGGVEKYVREQAVRVGLWKHRGKTKKGGSAGQGERQKVGTEFEDGSRAC